MAGVTVPFREWHRADAGRGMVRWGETLRGSALHVWLNFRGEGLVVWPGGSRVILRPGMVLWVQSGRTAPSSAHWLPGEEEHECLALTYGNDWLTAMLGGIEADLDPELRPLVMAVDGNVRMVERPLTAADRGWAHGFLGPHLCEQARELLDHARLTEFLLRHVLRSAERGKAVLTRTQRLAQERTEKVKRILLSRLDDPPPLEKLAAAAGCSAPYLSRTFAEVEGRTLSLWLRGARIERAAELLRTGQCNVSEAALEVGYRSFSHFSRAFQEEKGMTPSRWLQDGV